MQQQILELLRNGEAAAAIAAARELVAAQPDDAAAPRLLGAALRANGEAALAAEVIAEAIARFPGDVDLQVAQALWLIDDRDLDAARTVLSRGATIDPNNFLAYLLQAQLAMAGGDLEEAARLTRLSARVAPDHPWQAMIEGLLALRQGRAQPALARLLAALDQAPDDPQLLHATGLAYIANGHVAFAEQAFRRLVEMTPASATLRWLLADLVNRQGRSAEAAAVLDPLLETPERAPAWVHRFAGQLQLAARKPDRALPHLRVALAARPGDPLALSLALAAWRGSGDLDDARNTLDAALATATDQRALWRARLSVETEDTAAALPLLARWEAALPDDIGALEAALQTRELRGETDEAAAVARRIIARAPAHGGAQRWLAMDLLDRDPAAAAAHLRTQLAIVSEPSPARDLLHTWLGLACDRLGEVRGACDAWLEAAAESHARRVPRPAPTGTSTAFAPLAPVAPDMPRVMFLFGPPGSQVERLAAAAASVLPGFRSDRFGPTPPRDALQDIRVPSRIAEGSLAAADVAGVWRAHLPQRRVPPEGGLVDWLPWWDNALVEVFRAGIPEAELVIALRDPRDMLLSWLAAPPVVPFRVDPISEAAGWLAQALDQVLVLQAAPPCTLRLVRLDHARGDAPLAVAVATLAGIDPAVLPRPAPQPPPLLPPGRWRAYAEPLGDAFARLTDVARRLGYQD